MRERERERFPSAWAAEVGTGGDIAAALISVGQVVAVRTAPPAEGGADAAAPWHQISWYNPRYGLKRTVDNPRLVSLCLF